MCVSYRLASLLVGEPSSPCESRGVSAVSTRPSRVFDVGTHAAPIVDPAAPTPAHQPGAARPTWRRSDGSERPCGSGARARTMPGLKRPTWARSRDSVIHQRNLSSGQPCDVSQVSHVRSQS